MFHLARLLVAFLLFCIGIYLGFDLFVRGFDFLVLIAAIGCFVLACLLKPKRRSNEDLSSLPDILEFILEIPFRAIAAFLRALGRICKGDIDGIDF